MKVKKAVIPAAGLGTRMLPISKSVPKEMLAIVDKPAIQYLVEEAVNSGITDILIISNRGKESLENHFDYNPDYSESLRRANRLDDLAMLNSITEMANVSYIRQNNARGLGHAVSLARSFVGNEPFAVMYGDDIIFSETPVTKQLTDIYDEFGLAVAGVRHVDAESLSKYCSLKATPVRENVYHCTDMIEKPRPEQVFTDLAILGRVVLTPEIFDILDTTPPGAKGEIQLTDAMACLARTYGMKACVFEGDRFDVGNKLSYIESNVYMGLRHPETRDGFREFILKTAKELENDTPR